MSTTTPRAWVAAGRTPALVLGRSQHALQPQTPLRVRRRASGGGAVLTGPWMLRALLRLPRAHPLARGGPTQLARWFGGLHLPWLRALGVAAPQLYTGPFEDHWACFLGRGPGEVLVDDRKLVGIAQAWHRDRILLWSATLLEPSPWARLGEAFGRPEAAEWLAARTISAAECLGGPVPAPAWTESLRRMLEAGRDPVESDPPHDARRRRLLAAGLSASLLPGAQAMTPTSTSPLPRPETGGPASLPGALARRRSVRSYARDALPLAELGELLWAAQGISDPRGLRTAPSAGALYPLDLLLLARRVEGLRPGFYRYQPQPHALEALGELPAGSPSLVPGQDWVAAAPVVLLVAAVTQRTAARYGARAGRYVAIEAGAAAQNVALRATTLGLGSVIVGAFDDDAVRRTLGLAPGTDPLLLMPLGRPTGG